MAMETRTAGAAIIRGPLILTGSAIAVKESLPITAMVLADVVDTVEPWKQMESARNVKERAHDALMLTKYTKIWKERKF
jgi:hypothetical protein